MKKVLAWTDGACLGNPGPAGWAAMLRFGSVEKTFAGGEAEGTNNRAELMGAILALEALKEPCEILVHSDSQYVVKGASSWVKGWAKKGWKTASGSHVANRDLWERLVKAVEPHSVSWKWVRGHAGHSENERVDALANAEARKASGR